MILCARSFIGNTTTKNTTHEARRMLLLLPRQPQCHLPMFLRSDIFPWRRLLQRETCAVRFVPIPYILQIHHLAHLTHFRFERWKYGKIHARQVVPFRNAERLGRAFRTTHILSNGCGWRGRSSCIYSIANGISQCFSISLAQRITQRFSNTASDYSAKRITQRTAQ